MTTLGIITAIAIGVVLLLFSLLTAADGIGGIIAWIGNPLLRKLGLQGNSDPSKVFAGRVAKVLSSDGADIRVELDGTSWKATSTSPDWTPSPGESVKIESLDGLTLRISKGG